MENIRIHVKLGRFEFECFGKEPVVKQYFEEFKSLIPEGLEDQMNEPQNGKFDTGELVKRPTDSIKLRDVFSAEPSKGVVSLHRIPTDSKGKIERLGETALILLYGFDKLMSQRGVLVTSLSEGLRQSGLTGVERLSLAIAPLYKEGKINRNGKGKGMKYHITNKGILEAENLLKDLLAKVS